MKKIFTFLFLGLLLISITQNVNALEEKSFKNKNNVTITEENFLGLMDAGYTIDEIYNMSEQKLKTAISTKDLRQGSIAIKYFKTTTRNVYGKITNETEEVSATEYKSSNTRTSEPIIGQGITETTYKRLISTIYTYDSTLKRFKAYLYWKQMPYNRSYDIIGIAFQDYYVDAASVGIFQHLYTINSKTYVSTSHYGKSTATGAGASFKLPSGNISTLCQEISLLVAKDDPSEQITNMMAVADYAHATSNVSGTNSQLYAINHVAGLNLDATIINSYDTISTADAYVNWY